jgi:7-cyano-7-deazaguanine synthase in queuosine biosynthesis
MKRADHLAVDFCVNGRNLILGYRIDSVFKGTITIEYPFDISVDELDIIPHISLAITAFLAELCLAKTVSISYPCSRGMVKDMMPLIRMLYDVRCFRDNWPLVGQPTVLLENEIDDTYLIRIGRGKRAIQLASGGFDSTYSMVLLRKNGFKVRGVHYTVNTSSLGREFKAAKYAGKRLHTDINVLKVSFEDMVRIGKRYAINFARKSRKDPQNDIPFGREMLLFFATILLAKRWDVPYICAGHEWESREKTLKYRGRTIRRHPLESIKGYGLVQSYMNKHVSKEIRIFSPVGQLNSFSITVRMFRDHPEIARRSSFCWWGNNCGRCNKCLRYFFIQRYLGVDYLRFKENPLRAPTTELRKMIALASMAKDPDVAKKFHHGFKEWLFCLDKIVERGEDMDTRFVREFKKHAYESFRPLAEKYGNELMAVHRDRFVPRGFKV